jgi:uncharacterized membrane protein YeaQ/YmgE (transglycosylase-associated protein family)
MFDHLIWFLLVGLAAGWLAGQILRSPHRSLLVDLIVGVIGAILGGTLFGLIGLRSTGLTGEFVTALLGSLLLVFLLRRLGW